VRALCMPLAKYRVPGESTDRHRYKQKTSSIAGLATL